MPAMTAAPPAAGCRVRQTAAEYAGSDVHHSLYLPPDWRSDWKASGKRWPVIVEYTGNLRTEPGLDGRGGQRSTGLRPVRREGAHLGRDAVRRPGPSPQRRTWWGDEEATVQYCKTNLPRLCETYGGDRRAVVLCGFSPRGHRRELYRPARRPDRRAVGRLRHARPLRRRAGVEGATWGYSAGRDIRRKLGSG